MNSRIPCKPVMALAVVALCCQITPVLMAQDSAAAPASETRSVQLSSGVPEILKLVRAQVSDTITLSFIRNSGRTYQLSTSEIIYLHEQGVSDPVMTAMLNAQPNVAATAPQATPQPASAYVAPPPAYVQPSTVYVEPVPSYNYYDYGYYDSWPYYGGYWGYPSLSFGFGFGGGRYGGYYGGGYHSGGYPGGHSGGGSHPGGYPGGGSVGGGHSGGGNPGGGRVGGGSPGGGRSGGGGHR